MRRHPNRVRQPCLAALVAASLALAVAIAAPTASGASFGTASEAAAAGRGGERAEAARVLRYWTPERMRSARPLDLVVDGEGRGRLRVGPAEPGGAGASFLAVPTPEVPPFSFNGRIFLRRGALRGYCSGTAIDTPTRQLVLTAGHCVNSGPEGGHRGIWSDFVEFVPAYTGGLAPFGAFVARRDTVRSPKQWVKQGNPDFDLGAFLTQPNARGENVADAVGGGAAIVIGVSRRQQFQTFGYPGEARRMQTCSSPYVGDDTLTYPFPGPPTLGIRCHWAPGASGGGWLIGEGRQINGVNSYLHFEKKSHTYGPYFTQETVGKLVQGL